MLQVALVYSPLPLDQRAIDRSGASPPLRSRAVAKRTSLILRSLPAYASSNAILRIRLHPPAANAILRDERRRGDFSMFLLTLSAKVIIVIFS